MRVTIDLDKCVMAGECVYNHPGLFEFGDDDLPRIKVADLTGDDEKKGARQAREVCPSGAIQLSDD
jgi:ferredoxin